ncbi:serrate RNA effector molecule homolog [Diabrotica virgifera virgifera]|uniref:Serrate RNA effector molecule homolog n=3 Tax=Diabrotica virgifera virgifera TaxID=50390 RepID=A0ABM5KCS9_DIAVI|nr:serrate RNA effector molecule homolog [Diabrotica virgifera virgifera]
MADSDDEYDRKRRDKFRGERAEASYRGAERVARPRDEWAERDSWSRPRPREYRSSVRDRGYSPNMEPAPKRIRHDYYGGGGGDGYYNHYGVNTYHQPAYRESMGAHTEGQQPPMMSFKAFLATQDDNISDSEAIEKYNDYKLEFQRQQLNEFFVAHKDDEWFRLKYHPEESVKRKEEQKAALKRRVDVFIELLNAGKIECVKVDCAETNKLLKLLDTVVIKLEGGTDEDLAALEQEYEGKITLLLMRLNLNLVLGPDFVRKHIFNKHAEKLVEVRKEVEFFNNYLKDPKRPMLAEAPQQKREEPASYPHMFGGGGYGGSGYTRPAPFYNQSFVPRTRGYQPRGRGGPTDFRPVIHYRDLDAPREPEEFI